MSDEPVELDTRRGMAAQKATGLRRILAEAEAHAAGLRDRQNEIERHLLDEPAVSWPEAAAKARYILNLYYATLGAQDTHHRDLVASVLKDFARLDSES
ncbi:hypothetical protein [Bradyrhizobium sp. G127]|uniref:hypothetical protein n=1 Tax=Bradyrhizobium sp. G127 TaxID=2904800 RepID=UPI001F3465D6|nr:hypothetical protein [Bradyrhizobium sp. G127]MCF2524243.1 hypothetical protein [Bradyrhizobium sp. G127]